MLCHPSLCPVNLARSVLGGTALLDYIRQGLHEELSACERLPAVGTGRHGVSLATTRQVDEAPRLRHRFPPVAPAPQGQQDVEQVFALVGQHVFVARRVLLVAPSCEDATGDQAVEPFGEDVPGDPEIPPELVEPPDAQEGVAQDQHAPAVAEQLQAVGDHAIEMIQVRWHMLMIPPVGCILLLTRGIVSFITPLTQVASQEMR
jgi:hypothetical protein